MDLFEAMGTCRAMRYLKPDPVPDELIEKVIWGATRASSPGNTQGWEFVVVRDAKQRLRLGDALRDLLLAGTQAAHESDLPPEARVVLNGARRLARTLHEAPVVIVVCGPSIYPVDAPDEAYVWSAVYPASQNLILAARAEGLGTTFTTFHTVDESSVREILGIPDDVYIGTIIPMGWPDREFGPVRRKDVAEVIHHDRW